MSDDLFERRPQAARAAVREHSTEPPGDELACNLREVSPLPPERLSAAVSELMTIEEYRERGRHPVPYAYTVPFRTGAVLVVGMAHGNEPDADVGAAGTPVTTEEYLRTQFREFKPDLILVEGWTDLSPDASPDRHFGALSRIDDCVSPRAAMRQFGESGFAAKLAIDAAVPVLSLEPTLTAQIEHLTAKGHDPSEVLSFFVARQVMSMSRDGSPLADPHPILERFKATGLFEERIGIEDLARIERALFGATVAEMRQEHREQLFDPARRADGPEGTFNAMARELGAFRDVYILEYLGRNIGTRSFRPMVVYGATHAVMLEPAVASLMEARQD